MKVFLFFIFFYLLIGVLNSQAPKKRLLSAKRPGSARGRPASGKKY